MMRQEHETNDVVIPYTITDVPADIAREIEGRPLQYKFMNAVRDVVGKIATGQKDTPSTRDVLTRIYQSLQGGFIRRDSSNTRLPDVRDILGEVGLVMPDENVIGRNEFRQRIMFVLQQDPLFLSPIFIGRKLVQDHVNDLLVWCHDTSYEPAALKKSQLKSKILDLMLLNDIDRKTVDIKRVQKLLEDKSGIDDAMIMDAVNFVRSSNVRDSRAGRTEAQLHGMNKVKMEGWHG